MGALLVAASACVPAPSPPVGAPAAAPARTSPASSRDTGAALIPPGFGSLRQDDVAVRLQVLGLQVRVLPLDESVIRTLSPDSYRTLHGLVESQRPRITAIERRTGLGHSSVWYVSFFGTEVGETRYSPMELIVTSVGRDFRPLDVIPLTPGFGEQRLRQRESQSALYVFDGQVDVNQPLVVQYETQRNSDWSVILERIERERAMIRARRNAR
jgi:hypothetical protein